MLAGSGTGLPKTSAAKAWPVVSRQFCPPSELIFRKIGVVEVEYVHPPVRTPMGLPTKWYCPGINTGWDIEFKLNSSGTGSITVTDRVSKIAPGFPPLSARRSNKIVVATGAASTATLTEERLYVLPIENGKSIHWSVSNATLSV